MDISASITMVDSFLETMTCDDCLTMSNFDLELHLMALYLLEKALPQYSLFMRPSMMSNQMVIIYAIYSRVLFEIIPLSGLGV